MRTRTAFGVGLLLGLLGAVAAGLWWQAADTRQATVQRTVVTTLQEEASASFLVTGTMTMSVTVRIDSSQFLTPSWVTSVLRHTQPGALPLLEGGSETQVRVPGTVSYGFNVQQLNDSMVTVGEDGQVGVLLPSLAVHSVAPDLGQLEVKTQSRGWMRLLPSGAPDAVRTEALATVEEAFRAQAEEHLETATQPRVNTARALKKMLRPPLKAAGVDSPRFRIRVENDLVLEPAE